MAKFILPIEFVVEAVNEVEATTRGRELAGVLYQQHAVEYYLLGQPRPIDAPDAAPAPAPAPATARRR